MADHPLRKRFPAMSMGGLQIMEHKLQRANYRQDANDRSSKLNNFWLHTIVINAIARKGTA